MRPSELLLASSFAARPDLACTFSSLPMRGTSHPSLSYHLSYHKRASPCVRHRLSLCGGSPVVSAPGAGRRLPWSLLVVGTASLNHWWHGYRLSQAILGLRM